MASTLLVAVAVGRGYFGNPGREPSALKAGARAMVKRQQTKRSQCAYSELSNVRNRVRL
jgi:hypothetical protein